MDGQKMRALRAYSSSLTFPLGGLVFLATVNLVTFWSHYVGEMMFPWDFLGGYHAHAVGWLYDGGFLQPPAWFPYGGMGFPAFWSLQSGAWYIPLQLWYWFFGYSLVDAARFQAIHVLMGAIGVFLLGRASGTRWMAALLGALIFHFSVSFYANQEHVDIVRGTALFPWLLLALHPAVLAKSWLTVVLAGVIVFQFLVAAYPGLIVTAFYAVMLVIAAGIVAQDPRFAKLDYLLRLCVAGMGGVLMALIKWLPVASALHSTTHGVVSAWISPSILPTLLFRYDLPFLPFDRTMQSIWCPPLALLMLPFMTRIDERLRTGLALGVAALVMGYAAGAFPELYDLLPGGRISRFPLSDWRPLLHVGSALLVAGLFQQMAAKQFRWPSALARGVAGCVGMSIAATAALSQGYAWSDIRLDLVVGLLVICTALVWLIYKPIKVQCESQLRGVAFLVFTTAILMSSYVQHFVFGGAPWRTSWTVARETALFGRSVETLLSQPRRAEWHRRPRRLTVAGYEDVSKPGNRLARSLNRSWYAQEFAMFGYNGLKLTRTDDLLLQAMQAEGTGRAIFAFMRNPSQVVLTSSVAEYDRARLAHCPAEEFVCGATELGVARMNEFRLDGASFSITANRQLEMLENEPWYSGWEGQLCNGEECRVIVARPSREHMRVWTIPRGTWRLETRYRTPLFWAARASLLAGAALLLCGSVLLQVAGVRRKSRGSKVTCVVASR